MIAMNSLPLLPPEPSPAGFVTGLIGATPAVPSAPADDFASLLPEMSGPVKDTPTALTAASGDPMATQPEQPGTVPAGIAQLRDLPGPAMLHDKASTVRSQAAPGVPPADEAPAQQWQLQTTIGPRAGERAEDGLGGASDLPPEVAIGEREEPEPGSKVSFLAAATGELPAQELRLVPASGSVPSLSHFAEASAPGGGDQPAQVGSGKDAPAIVGTLPLDERAGPHQPNESQPTSQPLGLGQSTSRTEQVPAQTVAASAPAPVRMMMGVDFGERLGVAIARQVSGGRDELTVRMDPAELGRIQVRLAFDEGGSLRAVVSTESPAVMESIRRDIGDITRALADAGVRADGQSFRFERGGGEAGSAMTGGGSSHRGWGDQRGGGQQGHDQRRHEPAWERLRSRSGTLDLMA